MVGYQQLEVAKQEEAIRYFAQRYLEDLTKYGPDFAGWAWADKVQKAFDKAEKMQTPWFAHEYIWESCEKEIMAQAKMDAEVAIYLEADDPTPVRLP